MTKTNFNSSFLCLLLAILGLFGCQPKIGTYFQNKSVRSYLSVPVSNPTTDEIKIGSYNVFFRNKILNLTQANEARGAAIGQWIKDQQLEVVALQETWDVTAMRQLLQPIRKELPYYTVSQPTNQAGHLLSGGLSIISKYPIVRYQFVVYEDCHGIDCLAAKGFIYVVLDLGQGQKIQLINTHLDAGDDPKDVAVRSNQLRQIQHFIEGLDTQIGPLFLAGDFNINRLQTDNTEFKQLLAILDLSEYSVDHPNTLNCEHTSVACQDAPLHKQLDYIFVLKNEDRVARQSTNHCALPTLVSLKRVHYLSDHKAVVATFLTHFASETRLPNTISETDRRD